MKIIHDTQTIKIDFSHKIDTKILTLLWENNLYNTKALCSGVGKCGKCKILFHSTPPLATSTEKEILTKEEIDSNIRLSCKHNAKNDDIIELLIQNNTKGFCPKEEKSLNILKSSENKKVCLAIDFGTTSLEYSLFSENTVYAQGKKLNPMQGIGSEIMTRLEFAKNEKNANSLKKCVWNSIESIIKEAEEHNFDIEKIVFSANSAMTYLSLGLESSCIATAPYFLYYKGADSIKFNTLYENSSIKNKDTEIIIPPLLAPFIGSDISTGLYYINKNYNNPYPYFFIDMGTNAEFVLALSENEGIMASAPLGPSVEGIGLTFGTVAQANSIVDFRINLNGLEPILLDNTLLPKSFLEGITGVGYLHLIESLLKLGIIDEDGHFNTELDLPIAKKIAKFLDVNETKVLKLLHDDINNFYLTSYDIESILMVKAAFRSSFEIILEEAKKLFDFNSNSIKNIFIAGAFGKHLKKENLTSLSFLPYVFKEKVAQVGNTSLKGAQLLCANKNQEEIKEFFNNYKHIELANHAKFQNTYIKYFNFKNI